MKYIQSHTPVITLGFLLTILGHEVLMAAAPHPSAHPGHAGFHEAPALPKDIECGPTTGMHSKPSSTFDSDDSAMSNSLPPATEELTGFLPHWFAAPDHPPDVRRALLQVYLN